MTVEHDSSLLIWWYFSYPYPVVPVSDRQFVVRALESNQSYSMVVWCEDHNLTCHISQTLFLTTPPLQHPRYSHLKQVKKRGVSYDGWHSNCVFPYSGSSDCNRPVPGQDKHRSVDGQENWARVSPHTDG